MSKFSSILPRYRSKHSILKGVLCATMLTSVSAPTVFAQDGSSADTRGLDEIIVTARKKAESLQDVPVAVAAVSGDTIEKYNFDQIDEVAARIPNIKIQAGGAGQGGGLFFRGIGSNPNAGAFESSMAINVDGAVVSTARIVQNSFFDVESFELLKGPQALYFGKAATAGVLSLRTKNPTDEFEASGSVSYELEQESFVGEAIVSGPLTDTLGARVAMRFKDTSVLNENIAEGVINPERGEESIDFRGTLVWEPSDALDFTAKYTKLNYENDGANQSNRVVTRSVLNPGADLAAPPMFVGTPFQNGGYVPGGVTGSRVAIPDIPQVANDPASEFFGDGAPYSENDTQFLNLNANYDISDNYRLVGTFSWTDIKDTGFDNFAQTYAAAGASASLVEWDFKTFEARLEAQPAENISFMLGGYYEDSNQFFDAEQYAGFAALGRLALGVNATTPGFEGAFYDVKKIHDTDTEISSFFGSADWEITDRLTLSAGLRYTDVSRNGTITVPYLHDYLIDIGTNDLYAGTLANALLGVPAPVPAPVVGLVQGLFGGSVDTRNGAFTTPEIEFEEDSTDFEAILNYEILDGQNVYVAYKEAYKPGGIDNSLTAWNDDIASLTSAGAGVIFQGENVDGFEIGYKGLLLDNNLRLNGVFYNYDYSDFQIQSFSPAAIAFILTNAGAVKSQGIEVDFEYLPSVDGLTLYGSVAWDNSEFEEFTDPVTGHILDGRRLSQVPEWSGIVGFNYENDLGSTGWSYDLGYNLNVSGEYFLSNQRSGNCGGCPTEPLIDLAQESYATHDIRAGITSPDNRWSFDVIANNVTDEYYGSASAGVAPGAIDDAAVFFNEGRTVTLRLGVRY